MTQVSLRPFNNSELLWKNLTSFDAVTDSTSASIQFPDEYATITELPEKIQYVLSFNTPSYMPRKQKCYVIIQ